MKRTALTFSPLLALALALPAAAAEPAKPAAEPAAGAGTQTGLTAVQVRELLTRNGFTRIDDPEFEEGMWETDATSADGNRVDVRVDANGRIHAEDIVSTMTADDIKARLTAAGYSKVHDVEFDDGVWEAEAERDNGKDVKLRVDPKDGKVLAVEND
ncbi:PepSY domain-containing protein [Pseudoxanthomonas sp. J35]|uniref:PepSY domain-containing protein n=1 Tax=Pseudoxanthomonas sp. J35 TaxID=935852 RepID=UPI00048B635A|nr:PepSY domain-containing protein [Pseudoxanthomonas sp. J35]